MSLILSVLGAAVWVGVIVLIAHFCAANNEEFPALPRKYAGPNRRVRPRP